MRYLWWFIKGYALWIILAAFSPCTRLGHW